MCPLLNIGHLSVGEGDLHIFEVEDGFHSEPGYSERWPKTRGYLIDHLVEGCGGRNWRGKVGKRVKGAGSQPCLV